MSFTLTGHFCKDFVVSRIFLLFSDLIGLPLPEFMLGDEFSSVSSLLGSWIIRVLHGIVSDIIALAIIPV
jgi:hypothetical protein